ncbi:MAG: hypothetical protein IH847_08150 [Acidobacteria bacterium]|nr:hypothetical protein [Acidobacteriota bacterium]
MKHVRLWLVAGSVACLVATLPAPAQHRITSRSATGAGRMAASAVHSRRTPARTARNPAWVVVPTKSHVVSLSRHTFIPGFGLVPVVRERFPVFGLGFDAHHFRVTHRRHGFGFGRGRFKGRRFFRTGFFPLVSSSVVVVPQIVEVPVVVVGAIQDASIEEEPISRSAFPAVAGLPFNWNERLQVAEPGLRSQPSPLPQLTLLVLKDGSIFAATDYWLEDGRLFYLSSTGAVSSVALGGLDWPMTTRLNAERGVRFVLRSAPR